MWQEGHICPPPPCGIGLKKCHAVVSVFTLFLMVQFRSLDHSEVFLAATAALKVAMSVCLSVCLHNKFYRNQAKLLLCRSLEFLIIQLCSPLVQNGLHKLTKLSLITLSPQSELDWAATTVQDIKQQQSNKPNKSQTGADRKPNLHPKSQVHTHRVCHSSSHVHFQFQTHWQMFEILSIDTKSWTETENVSARNFFTNIIQSGSMNFDHI